MRQLIDIEDLKNWRAARIQTGCCDYDEMEALAVFIETVEKIEVNSELLSSCDTCRFRDHVCYDCSRYYSDHYERRKGESNE